MELEKDSVRVGVIQLGKVTYLGCSVSALQASKTLALEADGVVEWRSV